MSIINDSTPSVDKVYSSSKIEELFESELPTISGSDDGKWLGVDTGKWDKVNATQPTPRAIFKISVTQDSPSSSINADKNYWEILDAIEAGKIVYAEYDGYDRYEDKCHFDYMVFMGELPYTYNCFQFGLIRLGDTCCTFDVLQINDNDEDNCELKYMELSPYVIQQE